VSLGSSVSLQQLLYIGRQPHRGRHRPQQYSIRQLAVLDPIVLNRKSFDEPHTLWFAIYHPPTRLINSTTCSLKSNHSTSHSSRSSPSSPSPGAKGLAYGLFQQKEHHHSKA
jgi:hypothetical protein